MRRTSHTLLASAALVLVGAATPAWPDEIVLDNGKTIVGRVVSEDDRVVKVETDGGTMTLERSRVREIRKKPVPAKPKDVAPAAPKAGEGDPHGDRPPYVPTPLKDLVAEMDAIRLATWKDPVAEVFAAPPTDRHGRRVEHADGRVTMERDLPRTQDGIARVWMLRRIIERAGEGMPGRAEWMQMSWRRRGRLWIEGTPERAAYVDHEEIAREIVTRFGTKDAGAWRRACDIAMEMQRTRYLAKEKGKAPDLGGKWDALLAAVTAATGDAAGARSVARVLEIECDAMDATPDGKVRLATERRALIREIVQTLK